MLKGLEPVKQRPGMYTRTDNPLHIIQEVLDNAAEAAQVYPLLPSGTGCGTVVTSLQPLSGLGNASVSAARSAV